MNTTDSVSTTSKLRAIVVGGLALFAMFFGAGNLIFPTMIGVESGSNLIPAIAGFVATGVLLPALAISASATSTSGTLGLTTRIGYRLGMAFTVVLFLSIGVLYAIPRVATVSYETSLLPLLKNYGFITSPGAPAAAISLAIFTLLFFSITAWLSLVPSRLVERIGVWLTPTLLILLVILLISAMTRLPIILNADPVEKYGTSPLAAGLIDGYSTMDAMASFVFGGVIIDSLRRAGFKGRKSLFRATISSGAIAAFILAAIYIGLSVVGSRTPREGIENGAQALSEAANALFGVSGQWIFGLIVFLACLTTAVGLVGSSSQFFRRFFPTVSHPTMVMIHVMISLAISNLGLTLILQIVGPVTLLSYPLTILITFIAVTDIFVPGHLRWTYVLAAWPTVIMAAWSALRSLGLGMGAGFDTLWNFFPFSAIDMAWVIPALIAGGIGFALDFSQGRLSKDQAWPDEEPTSDAQDLAKKINKAH